MPEEPERTARCGRRVSSGMLRLLLPRGVRGVRGVRGGPAVCGPRPLCARLDAE
jgi:hypothetical protein